MFFWVLRNVFYVQEIHGCVETGNSITISSFLPVSSRNTWLCGDQEYSKHTQDVLSLFKKYMVVWRPQSSLWILSSTLTVQEIHGCVETAPEPTGVPCPSGFKKYMVVWRRKCFKRDLCNSKVSSRNTWLCGDFYTPCKNHIFHSRFKKYMVVWRLTAIRGMR